MFCFGHYCFRVYVCLQISFFIVILIRIPAQGFIPGLQSYVYKIFSAQNKFLNVSGWFLFITSEYDIYEPAASVSISVTDFANIIEKQSHELFSISLLILHKLLCRLLCKIARIPMVIVKPHKLHMFYGIFMALYYVFTSMLIFIFKVCWKTPTNQVNSFCLVWVSTVMNIRADYRFCCFNINKLSRYVIFREASCTTDLLVFYLDSGQYRSVEGGNWLF